MERHGLDFLQPLSVPTVRALGASFVCLYTTVATRALTESYAQADIDVVLIHENDPKAYLGGQSRGELEAHNALMAASRAGMVGGHAIIFAPYDPFTPAQTAWNRPVQSDLFFLGVRRVLPKSRVWGYGDYDTTKHLFDGGLIGGAFQSAAASEGRWDERAQLRQVGYEHSWGNPAYDEDLSVADYFGQWRPGVPLVTAPRPRDVSFLLPKERASYNKLMDARKHPRLYRARIQQALAEMRVELVAIWNAANADGLTVEAWKKLARSKRFRLLNEFVKYPGT